MAALENNYARNFSLIKLAKFKVKIIYSEQGKYI